MFEIAGKERKVNYLGEKNISNHYGNTPYRYTPKSAKKIPKGDKGFAIVDKAFKQENEAETASYIPPQSPIAIQPGDKGFEIVGKAYNKWLWTFPEWKNKPSKIINPDTNWNLNAKPMTTKNTASARIDVRLLPREAPISVSFVELVIP